MDDTISRAAAIDAAVEAADEWDGGYSRSREEIITLKLRMLPSTYEWIPCSKRLPEEKGEYLVAYHPCYWDDVEAEVKVGIDSFRGKTSWAKQKYQRVIAWMPLPTPYMTADD